MLKRLLRPRTERQACLTLAGMLVALLGGVISIKLALWWGWVSLVA